MVMVLRRECYRAELFPIVWAVKTDDIAVTVGRNACLTLLRMIAVAVGTLRPAVDGEVCIAISAFDLLFVNRFLVGRDFGIPPSTIRTLNPPLAGCFW